MEAPPGAGRVTLLFWDLIITGTPPRQTRAVAFTRALEVWSILTEWGGGIKDPSPESRTPSGGTEVPQVLLCAASETAAVCRVRGGTAAVALRSLGRKLRAGVESGVLRVSLKHVQELPLLQPP